MLLYPIGRKSSSIFFYGIIIFFTICAVYIGSKLKTVYDITQKYNRYQGYMNEMEDVITTLDRLEKSVKSVRKDYSIIESALQESLNAVSSMQAAKSK